MKKELSVGELSQSKEKKEFMANKVEFIGCNGGDDDEKNVFLVTNDEGSFVFISGSDSYTYGFGGDNYQYLFRFNDPEIARKFAKEAHLERYFIGTENDELCAFSDSGWDRKGEKDVDLLNNFSEICKK